MKMMLPSANLLGLELPFVVLKFNPSIFTILLIVCGACQKTNLPAYDSVVTEIDGDVIYLSELDLTIQDQLYESLFGVYYVRKIALEEIIAERLLQKAAKNRHMSKEKLISILLNKRKSSEGLAKFILENNLQYGISSRENPLRLLSIETVEGRAAIDEAYEKKIIENYVDSLKSVYVVKKYLDPPSPPPLKLSNLVRHSRGTSNPVLNVWIVSDFECPECQKYNGMFELLYGRYKDMIQFNFTHLSSQVTLSSVVAECCAEQGRFWEMHDLIFSKAPRDTSDFLNLAESAQVNPIELKNCISSDKMHSKIEANIASLSSLKVSVTPSLIIDGAMYYGEFSLQKISDYLNEMIKRKKEREKSSSREQLLLR